MSSCVSTPKEGGQAAGFVGSTVRYVVSPVSFRSLVPPLESCVGAIGNPAGAGPGGGAGTLMNLEYALTFVSTKFGSAEASDKSVILSTTGVVDMPCAPPGGLYTTERSKFAGFTVFCLATTPNRSGHDSGLAACT